MVQSQWTLTILNHKQRKEELWGRNRSRDGILGNLALFSRGEPLKLVLSSKMDTYFALIVLRPKDFANSTRNLLMMMLSSSPMGHRVPSVVGMMVAPWQWIRMDRFAKIVAVVGDCAGSMPILVTVIKMLCTITIHTTTTITGMDTPFSIRLEISKLWNFIFRFHTHWLCCVAIGVWRPSPRHCRPR